MPHNILFLTQVLPYPLDAGPKVRAYYMLRHLAGQHRVTLVSFVRADDRPEHLAHLAGFCHAVHAVPIRRSLGRNIRAGLTGLLTGLPIVIARDEMAEMAETLRRLTAETVFDLIHADQLSMAAWGLQAAGHPYRPLPPFASFVLRVLRAPARLRGPDFSPQDAPPAPATLLDEHNAIYLLTERMSAEATGLRRAIMAIEARAFRRYEAAMVRAYDALLTVTEQDRTHLLALFDEPERPALAGKFTVLPICVAPEKTPPVDWETRVPMNGEMAPPARRPGPVILHLGTMFWPPNVSGVLWFARQVLPLVWAQAPAARLVIVGKNPPPEVQALAADARIEVKGYVADPRPDLEAADVFIVPLFAGGGMRVKIVDAWLWGLPIVSTPIGAEGIEVLDGENMLIAGGAASYAAAVLRLLTDTELNRRLRANGRRWVEQHYAWQTVYRRLDAVYQRLLG